MSLERFLPARDLWDAHRPDLGRDVPAALAVAFLAVPQGVAYALIAGLPPAMGLYAAAVPAILSGLTRSSRHVVAGPTNALSLLVGIAVASTADDPVTAAILLALMIGVLQIVAGALSLGALVDYLSSAVVLGYITGAAVLIGVGQLPNITATPGGGGNLFAKLAHWIGGVADADPLAVGLALGTAAVVLILRRVAPKVPGAIVAMAGGIGLSYAFDLGGSGLRLVRDLAPVPVGLPPLGLPPIPQDVATLLPLAVAGLVLSLVESSAVARSIASRTGDRLDMSTEFFGQGIANLASALTGGYAVSGSLARSALTESMGAASRLAGILSGVVLLGVLLVAGPVVDLTPIASLAGLLLVIAADLVDIGRIKRTLRGTFADRVAFLTTLFGAWVLRLDHAIYLGVAISIVLFLRRARLLTIRELRVGPGMHLREADIEDDDDVDRPASALTPCSAIRVLHLEGSMFFGAAGELQAVLDLYAANPDVKVLIVRMKRTRDLDLTTAEVLQAAHRRMAEDGRHLLLVGMRDREMDVLRRTGTAASIGDENLFPTEAKWFFAMNCAITRALELVGPHDDDPHCPLRAYIDAADPADIPCAAQG